MPKSLADAKIKLTGTTTKPESVAAAKISELTGSGAVDLMCGINKADYKLGATGNVTISEQEACKKGEGNAPGPAQYDGNLTAFMYLDVDGEPASGETAVYDFLDAEGATVFLFEREGKPSGAAWTAGDTYTWYEAVLGVLTPPDNRFEGYSKRTVKPFIQDSGTGVVAAS